MAESPLVIEWKGLEELQKALSRVGAEWYDIANRSMTPGLDILVNEVVTTNPHEDQGILNASFGSARAKGGIREISRTGSQIVGKIGSRLPYAPVMLEYGRKPGARMPPPEALEMWTRPRGLAGLEFVIARAIGRRGIPASKTISKAIQNKAGAVVKKFEEGIDRELRRLNLR